MIDLSRERTRRLLAVHGWSGTLLGLVLYVVVLTGALAVFAHQIGIWSAGGERVAEPLAGPIDGIVRDLAGRVPAEWREDVSVFHNPAGNLMAFFHTHEQNADRGRVEDLGVMFEADARTGEVLQRWEGWGPEVFSADPAGALDHFLVDLHITLHMPDPWGLYATGILGFVMLIAAVSGLLIHRHLIREAFLSPRSSNDVLMRRDRHVLAATWSLGFAVVLAFTGAFYSFAGALGLPLVATTAFGGDMQAMIETVVGAPAATDETPTPIADLDTMKAESIARVGTTPTSITIAHLGRADAEVQIFHPPANGSLQGVTHVFDGTSGAFRGPKPSIGTEPSTGSAALSLMGPLHFGNFAGVLSRFVWLALGLVMAYVTLTGIQLWLARRADDPLWRAYARWVPVVGYGTPLGLAAAGHAFFVAFGTTDADPHVWTAAGFLGASAVAVVAGLIPGLSVERLDRLGAATLSAFLLTLPLTRLVSGGPGWPDAIAAGDGVVMLVDALIFGAGTALLLRRGRVAGLLRPSASPRREAAITS